MDLLSDDDSWNEDRHTGRTRRLEARDIAVLCQTHAQCSNYAEALRSLHMPVCVSGTGWWTSPLVQAARFDLSVAANPADKHVNLCFASLGPPRLPLESCLAHLVTGMQIEAPVLSALRTLWHDCLGKAPCLVQFPASIGRLKGGFGHYCSTRAEKFIGDAATAKASASSASGWKSPGT